MASIPTAVAASAASFTVMAVGAAANLAASNNNKPLASKIWDPSGRFIGLTNGRTATMEAPSSAPPASTPATTPEKSNVPIGGATDKPAPPTPFGRFPKCRPTKLPGPPKPYNPADSP